MPRHQAPACKGMWAKPSARGVAILNGWGPEAFLVCVTPWLDRAFWGPLPPLRRAPGFQALASCNPSGWDEKERALPGPGSPEQYLEMALTCAPSPRGRWVVTSPSCREAECSPRAKRFLLSPHSLFTERVPKAQWTLAFLKGLTLGRISSEREFWGWGAETVSKADGYAVGVGGLLFQQTS